MSNKKRLPDVDQWCKSLCSVIRISHTVVQTRTRSRVHLWKHCYSTPNHVHQFIYLQTLGDHSMRSIVLPWYPGGHVLSKKCRAGISFSKTDMGRDPKRKNIKFFSSVFFFFFFFFLSFFINYFFNKILRFFYSFRKTNKQNINRLKWFGHVTRLWVK